MQTGLLKRALRLDLVGTMHIHCGCGAKLPVPNPFTAEILRCACGVCYDSSGWILVDRKRDR